MEQVRRHFKAGWGYKFPLCCILHFCLDQMLDRRSAERRGSFCTEERGVWVPCSLHLLFKRFYDYKPHSPGWWESAGVYSDLRLAQIKQMVDKDGTIRPCRVFRTKYGSIDHEFLQ